MPAPACPRRVQGDLGLAAAAVQVGKAGKCRGNVRVSSVGAAGQEGKLCLGSPGWPFRAVSEKPEAGWLQDDPQSLAQCRESQGRHSCSTAPYKRAWAGSFPVGQAGKGRTGMEGDRQGMAHQRHSTKPGKAGWESLVLSWCWRREAAPSSQDGVAELSHRPAATLLLQLPDERSPGWGSPGCWPRWTPSPQGVSSPRCCHTPAPERGPCPAASPAAPGLRLRSAVTSAGRCRRRSRRGPAAGSGSSATGTP